MTVEHSEEIHPVDYPLFTVPAHTLVSSGTRRRSVHNDLMHLFSHSHGEDVTSETVSKQLRSIASSIESVSQDEQPYISAVNSLLSSDLQQQLRSSPFSTSHVNSARIDRLILEYLHRRGYTKAAQLFTQSCHTNPLVSSINPVFELLHSLLNDLRSGNTDSSLQWLHSLPSTKEKDDLVYRIVVLQACVCVRNRNFSLAINSLRNINKEYKEPLIDQSKLVGKCLLFANNSNYLNQVIQDQIDHISTILTGQVLGYFKLGRHSSLLEICAHTGLATLKTPFCDESTAVQNCPTCKGILAEFTRKAGIKPSFRTRTVLHCPVSREDFTKCVCYALPNSNVYSSSGLIFEGDMVRDPESGELFSRSDLRRVFVA
ncbi:hypothetical protein P9112_000240 [Eukaryota sp. TZLM1-RC]